MTSISSKYYQFILAQGVVSAIGASALFTPCKPPGFLELLLHASTYPPPSQNMKAEIESHHSSSECSSNLVPPQTWPRLRNNLQRLQHRRHHLPNHDQPLNSPRGLRMGHENRRAHDPCTPCHRQPHRQNTYPSSSTSTHDTQRVFLAPCGKSLLPYHYVGFPVYVRFTDSH
jgi:hypothetical protein